MSPVLGCQVTSVKSYREIQSEGRAAVTHPYTLIRASFLVGVGSETQTSPSHRRSQQLAHRFLSPVCGGMAHPGGK